MSWEFTSLRCWWLVGGMERQQGATSHSDGEQWLGKEVEAS